MVVYKVVSQSECQGFRKIFGENDNDSRQYVAGYTSLLRNSIWTYVFGFIVVNAWRGLWLCQDLYIVFDELPTLSPWLSHCMWGIYLGFPLPFSKCFGTTILLH